MYFEITPGVKKTFNDVFDELYVPLCYFSNSILENNALAEDVVQSVFLKLWEQREKRNKINNVKAYIYRSVHNASIDRLRKEERTVSISKELVQNENIELRIIEEEVSNELKKVLRLLPQAIEGMKAGQWQSNLGDRVFEKTIGIWGYGKIGKRIAQYAKVFGAKVIVWGSENSRSQALSDGFGGAATKEEFFQTSDVITMHLRLHPATTAIVTLEDLRLMKPTALFVNTARAALIAPNALLTALKEGNPGRAALDVYDQEPIFDPAHPLLTMENVICSPHLGYVERQGYELYYSIAFENVLNYLKGSPTGIKDL